MTVYVCVCVCVCVCVRVCVFVCEMVKSGKSFHEFGERGRALGQK